MSINESYSDPLTGNNKPFLRLIIPPVLFISKSAFVSELVLAT